MVEADDRLERHASESGMSDTDTRDRHVGADRAGAGGDGSTSREHFPKEMAGYLRVFYKREPRRGGVRRSAAGMRDGRGAR